MPRPAAAPDDQRIRHARMTSLLLDDHPTTGRTVAGVVQWFGAMQGQDFASVTWSLGLRTGRTRAQVEEAFETGEILRTWPMRGTLHVVPGADSRWMIEHLGARALRGAAARREFLGLTEQDADRAADVIGEALAGGRAMTRAECVAALEAAGISGAGQRAYHLLWYTSQKGITCVGPQRGKEQTFVLLDDFAAPGPDLDRPAALATIAGRFVRSHAPVSAQDLARWADLSMADARAGLATADGVIPRTIGGRDLFVAQALLDGAPARIDAARIDGAPTPPARALPGFDEFVLGYRDRTAQLDAEHEQLVVPGGNGVFGNTLVVDGRVVGTWRRRELAQRVDVTATPFTPISAGARRRLEGALDEYAAFVGKPARLTWADSPGPTAPTRPELQDHGEG
jgi:hypothetical protein